MFVVAADVCNRIAESIFVVVRIVQHIVTWVLNLCCIVDVTIFHSPRLIVSILSH